MNFFEHQDEAKRNTRKLVLLFMLAVIAIIIAIDAVLLFLFGSVLSEPMVSAPNTLAGLISANSSVLLFGTGGTGAAIGLASLYRNASLRDGGGSVARQMGGVPVEADPKDPLRQRLRNVVEEIAIASGVPVPEIYILEQEAGINAFAAGYSPSDAAVAVTRGTLETLNREELQGVIAHEFSHIFNGDMRLNIRLMGALFGILILAIAGRRILSGMRFSSRSKNNGGNAIMLFAVALMAIGYIGLFFARWIKAAVSRQREYLADASAVQFTRNPQGIAGALKKIAVHSQGTVLEKDSEEVAHMLFGQGSSAAMLATHPPIVERIQRIEPGFREEELDDIAKRLSRRTRREAEQEQRESKQSSRRAPFDPRNIIEGIGQPDWERIVAAAALAAALPVSLVSAARSTEWAPELLLCVLLDDDEKIRDQQLFTISKKLGAESETQVRYLLTSAAPISAEQRLPLLEIAFSALKRRPTEFIHRMLETVTDIVHQDGKIEVFEFLLAKVISLHLTDAMNPAQSRTGGRYLLTDQAQSVRDVIAILADHGHSELAMAQQSYQAGIKSAGLEQSPMNLPADWPSALDKALSNLDLLKIKEKERLITALVETILSDAHVATQELELLRAIGSALHVPLPLLSQETRATDR
ncbi:MAG: M48 family metallopeptidase [Candidatus Thiodiazotropha sp. (ex Notomyrtea botanica)]|nr:M48 family metallopeptidase [Candidatus Thiodiazotropha sp. (ex Notomyrtea botanica)]